MKTIFLSERNLRTLLSKIEHKKAGEQTACAIIKYKNAEDPEQFQQGLDAVCITAVPDREYYVSRPAGAMLPVDEPPAEHNTGTSYSGPIL